MIKLYGNPRNSSSRCIVLLEEIGEPYELISVDLKVGDQKKPDYLALNPNGKVPTMVDGEFVLWESFAINQYLAEKFKPELLGRSLEERALVRQWSDWVLNHVQPYLGRIMYHLLFNRLTAENAEEARRDITPFLKVLDRHLQNRDHVVTNALTLADINLAAIFMICSRVDFDLTPYPEIDRWLHKMLSRRSFERVAEMIV